MDASLLEELIAKNKPFKIETASGRLFEVPHRDFVSFSTRKTSLLISYEENGAEHFAIVPLLTITAAMARARHSFSSAGRCSPARSFSKVWSRPITIWTTCSRRRVGGPTLRIA